MTLTRLVALLSALALVEAAPRPQQGTSTSGSPTIDSTVLDNTLTATPTVSAVTSTSPYSIPSAINSNPCAVIASLVANSNASVPTVPAQLGYDCLTDVPLDGTAAVPWLQSLRPYIEWQSTLAYLDNPPDGYLEPPIDVFAEYEALISRAQSGAFKNEYELEFALYRLFQRTHDGHFRYSPNLIANVLVFGRPLSLVSVSVDGKSLPKPYVYADVLLSLNVTGFAPSAITTIDGEDAASYLETWSQYGSLQDPDALYNNVFFELAQASLGRSGSGPGSFSGSGRGAYIFPGPSTTLTFENGTASTYQNFARILQPFTNITSGADVYQQYVNPVTQTSSGSGTVAAAATSETPRPGYPPPVIVQENNLIGGYYLEGAGYENIAVLSVPSFVSLFSAEQAFQDVAYNFIAQSKVDGKTKLVIDVSANGGGTILQGYSLFTNLFPDLFPYGATRFRAHEAFDVIGRVVSDRIPYYPWDVENPPDPLWNDFVGVPFNYRADVDINYENFNSWEEKFGPHAYYGDNFTSIIRWNLSDPTTIYTSGVIVNGFQNRTGFPPSRPYKAEDIVILYDGYCASTCTVFSEFMTSQAGIKTIAIGGRPQAGPMQAVGGVKGTNNYPWASLYVFANETFELAPDLSSYLSSTVLGSYSLLPFTRATPNSGQVNVRDGIRQGDETQTPLQFVYEAADCRIYYTLPMTVDVTAQWKEAADVAWGEGECAEGAVGIAKRTVEEPMAEEKGKREETKKKVRRDLSEDDVRALWDAMDIFTDMRNVPAVNGYMAP